jgi:DNA repair protein RadC
MTHGTPPRTRPVRRVVSTLAEVVAEGPARIAYRDAVRTAEYAYTLVRQVLDDRPAEEFWVILLDAKNRPSGMAQVSVGCLTWSVVHPREVYGPAVRMGAAAIIVAHNHPSGDPEPSAQDLEITKRLIAAGELLGIPLLDHLVCGDSSFVGLRSRGAFG